MSFVQTGYRASGAGSLLSYMEHGKATLRDRHGNEMDGADQQQFIEKSERHQFERDFIISPENGDELSDEELSLQARKVMGEFIEDAPTVDYCYSVHRDTEHPHVHVAATGSRADLYMDRDDIEQVRERATEVNREMQHEREREAEMIRDWVIDRDREPERGLVP